MLRHTRDLVVVAVLATGCATTRSTPGTFVTNVTVVPTGLLTTTCDVEHDVTRTLLTSGPSERSTTTGCHSSMVTFPAEPAPQLPERCWVTVEVWAATPATDSARAVRWNAIPPECRALLAGGGS